MNFSSPAVARVFEDYQRRADAEEAGMDSIGSGRGKIGGGGSRLNIGGESSGAAAG